MNPKDYSEFAIKLNDNFENIDQRISGSKYMQDLVHGALGMSGETGETVDLIKKHFAFGKPLDLEKLKLELGDVVYYMNLIILTIGSSWEEIMELNHKKLSARYPEGFSQKAALERKDLK